MPSILAITSLAATAGILAFFSPCGYALLPAYIGFFMARKEGGGKKPLAQGVLFGLSVSAGFLVVLAILWTIIASIGNIASRFLPQVTLVLGILLVLFGLVMLFKPLKLNVPVPKFLDQGKTGYLGAFIFGAVYLIGGIGCTLPVFVAVLAQAATLGVGLNVVTFLAFAAPMIVLMLLLTTLLALARQKVFDKFKKVIPYIQRAGAVLLVVAGAILVWRELPLLISS